MDFLLAVSFDASFEYLPRCYPNRLNRQGKGLGLVTIKAEGTLRVMETTTVKKRRGAKT